MFTGSDSSYRHAAVTIAPTGSATHPPTQRDLTPRPLEPQRIYGSSSGLSSRESIQGETFQRHALKAIYPPPHPYGRTPVRPALLPSRDWTGSPKTRRHPPNKPPPIPNARPP